MSTPGGIGITPRSALQIALEHYKTVPGAEDMVEALSHALECLHDMSTLLRYIRLQLPDREPELKAVITKQLVKGCDI